MINSKFFTSECPSPERIRNDIVRDGFAIYPNMIHPEFMFEMRRVWEKHFDGVKAQTRAVRGNLRLGEKNFDSFTRDSEWCLYRSFEFLWNPPVDRLTREVCVDIHRLRNLAQDFGEEVGLNFNEQGYGVYISTSLYPMGSGFLRAHTDGHQDIPILQYMVPLTFKGKDYRGGGLYIIDKNGAKIDVDSIMTSGSVVFFDGRMKHGVDTIVGENGLGRIATFAIPTFFRTHAVIPAAVRQFERVYTGVERRLSSLMGSKPSANAY
jgi:hypothetical protein